MSIVELSFFSRVLLVVIFSLSTLSVTVRLSVYKMSTSSNELSALTLKVDSGDEIIIAVRKPTTILLIFFFSFLFLLRSEEHTSELQSRHISYAVFCLKKKK